MRNKESKGFRLTGKRQEAIALAESQGKEFNIDIFKDPATRMMSILELVEFSDKSMGLIAPQQQVTPIQQELSQEQVRQNVHEMFSVMQDMLYITALGSNKSLFISGSAGVGKTESAKEVLSKLNVEYRHVKGKVSEGGLYTLLWENRFSNSVLLFDDSDDVLSSELSLNILKAATDSSDVRTIDWNSSAKFYDSDGEEIPSSFEFKGTIIFISNKDIFGLAKANNKMSDHFQALISRSTVIDVTLKTKDEYLARIYDVLYNKMDTSKYSKDIKDELYQFISEEGEKLQELSLRMIGKLYTLHQEFGTDWKRMAIRVYGKK